MKEFDQVLEDPRPFLKEVKRLSRPSSRDAVLKYLLKCLEKGSSDEEKEHGAVTKEERAALLSYVRNGLNVDGTEAETMAWQRLSDQIETMFVDNGFLLEEYACADWEEYFRGIVLDLSYEGLRDLALGTAMNTEELDRFFKQVLHRSGINFYRVEEVFLYLVLRYAEEAGEKARFAAMRKLRALYPFGRWKDRKAVKDIHMDGYLTRGVRTRDVRHLLTDLLQQEEWAGTLFTKRISSLDRFIRWIRRLEMEDHVRSCEEVFHELVDKLKGMLWQNKDFQEYLFQEEIYRESERVKKRCYKTAQVSYCADYGVDIPAKTLLSYLIRKNERMYEAVFEVTQAVTQEPGATMYIQVPVEPVTEWSVLEKYRELGGMKTRPKFVKEKYMDGGFQWCDPEMWQRTHDIRLLEKGGALPFVRTGEGKNGLLEIEATAGTVIPEGTLLYFCPAGVPELRFVYRVAEDTTAKAVCSMELRWVNHDTLWEKWPGMVDPHDVEIAPTGACLQARKETLQRQWNIEGVQICLEKPLKLYDSDVSEERISKRIEQHSAERKGGVRGRSKSNATSQISNLSLLKFLYQGPADDTRYYEGYPGWGEEFFLNSQSFLDTRLKNDILDKFIRTDGMRRRYLIETLVWLLFVLDVKNEENFPPEAYDEEEDYIRSRQADFEMQVERVMARCSLQGFSAKDPYDAYLQLLLTYDEPFLLFQTVWNQDQPLRCKPIAAGKRSKTR